MRRASKVLGHGVIVPHNEPAGRGTPKRYFKTFPEAFWDTWGRQTPRPPPSLPYMDSPLPGRPCIPPALHVSSPGVGIHLQRFLNLAAWGYSSGVGILFRLAARTEPHCPVKHCPTTKNTARPRALQNYRSAHIFLPDTLVPSSARKGRMIGAKKTTQRPEREELPAAAPPFASYGSQTT